MRHPLDRPVASDLSYESFQLRRRRFELTPPEPDNRLRRMYPIAHGIERHAFIASRETVHGESAWESVRARRRLER